MRCVWCLVFSLSYLLEHWICRCVLSTTMWQQILFRSCHKMTELARLNTQPTTPAPHFTSSTHWEHTYSLVWLFVWFLNVLVNYYAISRTGPKTERLTTLRAYTHETQLGDHDFCLSRSHYTDTDPTSRERAATAGIEPGTSSPEVARFTPPP